MNKVNWFDLDGSLWSVDAKWWIVDKNNPEKCVLKISQEEGSLVLGGIYRGDGNAIRYNGLEGWITNDLYDKIKKVKKIKLEDIGISFREFSSEDFLNQQADNIQFLLHNLEHVERETISLLTARGNRKLHETMLQKLRERLGVDDLDIVIDKVYFVNDENLTRHSVQPALKKSMVILEHMIGFRIEDDRFVDIEQERYGISTFFDDEKHNIDTALTLQSIYDDLLVNTKSPLKKEIVDYVDATRPVLKTYHITNNRVNPFEEKELVIKNKS